LDRERLMKWRTMVAYPDEARRLAKQV
jgi:hypothetical protein